MREQLGNASGLTTLTGLHIHLSSTEGQCACQMTASLREHPVLSSD